jgi:hypothetical protein
MIDPPTSATHAMAATTTGADGGDPIRVVYVACHGRSGSTLVGSILGLLDGFCFVGEVRTAWTDGIRDNRPCGCGKPFHECDFWTAVFKLAYGGFDTEPARAAMRLFAQYHRPFGTPFLWWSVLQRRGGSARMDPYLKALAPLYRAIHQVSGATVIVDTSKHLRYGMLLASMPNSDIRFVNLVRDVRAVVQSRARPALMRDGQTRHAGRSTRPHYRIAKVVFRWVVRNELGMRLIRRFGGLRVLYEAFARNPGPALEALSDRESCTVALAKLSAAAESMTVQHQLAGNWVRGLRLEVRETWATDLPRWVRVLTTALAWPFLRRYRFETHRAGGLMR